jgi:hypothetical protein
MREGRPAVTEWPESAGGPVRVWRGRLSEFRDAHPDVDVVAGPGGFWEADYRVPDGRVAYKARYDLPVLLDEVEKELRGE